MFLLLIFNSCKARETHGPARLPQMTLLTPEIFVKFIINFVPFRSCTFNIQGCNFLGLWIFKLEQHQRY
jgi:hypothetical protein